MLPQLFIENVSLQDVIDGNHIDTSSRSTVLIQIIDHEMLDYPNPKQTFSEIYQFRFDDTEDLFDPNRITDTQAASIAYILRDAYNNRKNIVVHCHAGICRSGAVVDCGTMIGFSDVEHRLRIPNVLVKRKILDNLNLSFDPKLSPFNV